MGDPTVNEWHSKYLEAQKALRYTKQRVKLQSLKSRQLVAAVKQKLEEKDIELTKVCHPSQSVRGSYSTTNPRKLYPSAFRLDPRE